MSVFRPFSAVRPKKEYAADVAALPYDVMSSEEARIKVEGKPYSFIHVDKAEVDLPEDTYLYSDEVYNKAAENLRKLSSDGICIKEETPCFYIYRQIMGNVCQTGIVGTASADDYLGDIIKKHEFTRADKEEDRIRHVDTCDANTGPIFLAYKGNDTLKTLIAKYTCTCPEYDFISEGDVKNTVWVVSDRNDIEAISGAFGNIPALYIADGHHRAASAVKVALKRRSENPGFTGEEEFNFFLAVAFSKDELKIMDYNRLIKDKNGYTSDELLSKIGEYFTIEASPEAVSPECRHSFGLYLDKKWYRLTLKEGLADENDALRSLDVSLLQKYVISGIFGIDDPRTDKRIDFVGGIRGLKELEKRCSEDMEIAFSMYPTSMDELMAIADSGRVMPPKSTWFEPKLLSGLFIHELK
ncbi:MAG: DUF1015 domain-containing protein [Clostridia bacterium]|nr:DUF1015 domain-containing protein [Clostridia bacterium]